MKRDGILHSLWQDTVPAFSPAIQPIHKDIMFDVVIAGGGITGLTTGLQLLKAGKSVLIAEACNIGFGTTGGTTAHLNTFLDTSYPEIEKKFGEKDAQTVATAVRQSLELIQRNIEEYHIECEYSKRDAILFAQHEDQVKELESLLEAAQRLHVACEWTNEVVEPFNFIKALKWPGQAGFHPLKYLQGLARAFEENGGILVQNCRITGVEEQDSRVMVQSCLGEISARNFVYATHIPPGVNLLHFRCAPYRSYAIAVELQDPDDYPTDLIYDMYDPYHYYRTQEVDGTKYLIAGGEDHKTGHEENTEQCFRKLEAHVRSLYRVKNVSSKWSSQYYEPVDGLPYIGHLPGHQGNVFVATGYSGNGMVLSGVAALLLTDLLSAGKSEWEETFDPSRIKMVAGFSNFLKEAADVTSHLFKKVFVSPDKLQGLADLAPGEAAVVKYEGQKIAIYKDEEGSIHALHAACTHIKCDVSWNNAERSWDCPCHGSRFDIDGDVLTAPARKAMQRMDIAVEAMEQDKVLRQ